jgi:hypothetical protein
MLMEGFSMSTKIVDFKPDVHGRFVVEGVFEQAVFSAFTNLVWERKDEGLTKAIVAERMCVDRATVTKLTTTPTNMKIRTAASFANALDADILFLLVDRHQGRMFSAIGTHVYPSAFQKGAIAVQDCFPASAHTAVKAESVTSQQVNSLAGK